VPDELEREKNVIVQEIGAAQDTLVNGFVVAVRCLRVGFGGMTALIRRLASTSLRLLATKWVLAHASR